ncbi:HAD hydrolase-like protein [Candidatus Woesearchaeota archaeon]|nr:HAD hydrolase-like protein [Candidatus Woesearchaeota archaeon]
MIKAIIFDWGRTLYDNDNNCLFNEAKPVLDYLFKKYILCIVSLGKNGHDIQQRQDIIDHENLRNHFVFIMFDHVGKDHLYEATLRKLKLKPEEMVIVDDRTVRGIAWGNKHQCKTVWLKKGKFSHEEPNEETGKPGYIIHSLSQLLEIL